MGKKTAFCFILFAILFSAAPFRAQAQSEVSAKLTALERHPQEDTVKINLLIDLLLAYRQNDPKKALEYADAAVSLAERLQYDLYLGDAYSYQSTVYYIIGDFKTAQTLCLRALSFYEKGNKYPNKVAAAFMNLGTYAFVSGETTTALKHYEAALAVFEQLQNIKSQISTIVGIANCYKRLGNNEKALELYLLGLQKNEKNSSKENVVLLYTNMAFLYEDMVNYNLSLDYRLKAIDILKASGDLFGLAKEYNNMSRIYYRLNDLEEAQKYLEKALELHRAVNDKFSIALATINISLTYADKRKAVATLEEVLVYCRESNNKQLLGLALKNLASIHTKLQEYTVAYAYVQEALEIEKDGKNQETINILKLNAAEIILECGDEVLQKIGIDPQSRYNKAKEYLDFVFLPANNANVRQSSQAWQMLSTIQEKQNNYTQAYESYKKYIVLKDSVASDEVKKQIIRKEIQYEFTKKETALQYQQQLTTEQLENQRLLTIQSEQTLALREQDLALSNKEKDLVHLAYLKEQAEKEKNAQDLSLSQEREKGKERDLLLKNLELSAQQKQNLSLLAFTLLLLSGLAALFYFYNILKKQKNIIARQNELNEQTINILSHDIRSPLMIVNLMLRRLNKDDPFVAEASQSLQTQINAVNSILNNLLQMKKMSLSQKGKHISANVNAVLKNVLQELSYPIQDKALTIQNQVKDDVSLPIAAEKLQIILHNLLSNAIKYSYPQQIIRIYEDKYSIAIQDSGIGLTKEECSTLTREASASKLGTQQELGSGLGLLLVGALLQGEDLSIDFDAPLSGGTIVRLHYSQLR